MNVDDSRGRGLRKNLSDLLFCHVLGVQGQYHFFRRAGQGETTEYRRLFGWVQAQRMEPLVLGRDATRQEERYRAASSRCSRSPAP